MWSAPGAVTPAIRRLPLPYLILLLALVGLFLAAATYTVVVLVGPGGLTVPAAVGRWMLRKPDRWMLWAAGNKWT